MPINKNALLRYKILDDLLSDKYHNYSLDDLTEEVNKRLSEIDPNSDGVVRRTIEKDIHFLEKEDPFWAMIERYPAYAFSTARQDHRRKHCLRYEDRSFSLFKKKLTDDEKHLLREVFSLLGQFDGLPYLEGLEDLRRGLGAKDNDKPIIALTKNPLENTNLFGKLFTAISQQLVIELHYHKFDSPDEDRVYKLYPYLLKEYNGRWYLFAARTDNRTLNCYSLDRMDSVKPLPSMKYKKYEGNVYEIFEDIIGVTFYPDAEVKKITFWVSDVSKEYVSTNPLHESQRTITKPDKEEALRTKYPTLKGGRFFRIDCKNNYELIRELCSYGPELIVLEPSDIQDEIRQRINSMNEKYSKITN